MAFSVSITFQKLTPNPTRPTIWEALETKLGRAPTHAEVLADMKRITENGLVERAGKGQLPHQRKRR